MPSEELKLLGELNGKMDLVINKLECIEKKVSEHDRAITRHTTYFKIMGAGLSILITVTAIVFF